MSRTTDARPGRHRLPGLAGDRRSRNKAEGSADALHHPGRMPEALRLKNVELSGGKIAKGIRVYDAMKRHRGANFGTATALSEEGWAVVEELAAEVVQAAKQPDHGLRGSSWQRQSQSRNYFL